MPALHDRIRDLEARIRSGHLWFIGQRKLLFWKKLSMHNNNFLLSLSWLVPNRFHAIGSVYGITRISASVGQIKSAVWAKFTETESFVMFV